MDPQDINLLAAEAYDLEEINFDDYINPSPDASLAEQPNVAPQTSQYQIAQMLPTSASQPQQQATTQEVQQYAGAGNDGYGADIFSNVHSAVPFAPTPGQLGSTSRGPQIPVGFGDVAAAATAAFDAYQRGDQPQQQYQPQYQQQYQQPQYQQQYQQPQYQQQYQHQQQQQQQQQDWATGLTMPMQTLNDSVYPPPPDLSQPQPGTQPEWTPTVTPQIPNPPAQPRDLYYVPDGPVWNGTDMIRHKRTRRKTKKASKQPDAESEGSSESNAGTGSDKVYALPAKLNNWGSILDKNGTMRRGLFVYDQRGTELAQNKFYRRTELAKFFVQHPDQQEPVRPYRRLTLWIQNTPAQLNTRYLNSSSSSKCRWRDCPDPTHTIQKGFWRVAFDEYSGHTTQNHTDPYLNAGYMHLYCFEKAFDLGYLIHHAPQYYGFRILSDNRHFPREERNVASLKRDHPEMSAVFEKWQNEQSQRSFPPGYTGFVQINVPDKDRLWSRLTEEHLRRESKTRDTTRKTRPGTGNHIAFHRGNLEMMVKVKQAEKANKKRKNNEGEEEDGGGSDDDEGVEQPRVVRPVPVPKKRRVESPLESPHRLGGLVGLGINNTQPGPQAGLSFYYPVPDNSAGPSLHYPAPPAIPQQHGFYNIDPALAASSATPFRPPPQGPSTPRLEPVPASLPRTRKRSKENAEEINERLSKKPMTRGGADEIVVAMQNEPQHIRDSIISAAPASSAAILKERIQKRVLQGETLPEVHEYYFDARVGKLRTRERLNLDATLIKLEKHQDPKKNNSI